MEAEIFYKVKMVSNSQIWISRKCNFPLNHNLKGDQARQWNLMMLLIFMKIIIPPYGSLSLSNESIFNIETFGTGYLTHYTSNQIPRYV